MATYDTQVYSDIKIDIKEIITYIELGKLSKTSIPLADNSQTIDIYDVGDEGYNIFVLDKDEIVEHFGVSKENTIAFLNRFVVSNLL